MVTRVLAKTTKVKKNIKKIIYGKKKLKRILSCLFGGRRKDEVTNLPSRTSCSAANTVGTTPGFTAFGSGPEAKPSRANAFWFFLSTTMVFVAFRTHFSKKNTRVLRNTITCVTHVTWNRVEVHRLNSQHLAMVRTVKHGRASAFRYFLSTAMVFTAVRINFPKTNNSGIMSIQHAINTEQRLCSN